MTKKTLLTLFITILSVITSLGQFEKYSSYDELESVVKAYVKNNNIDSSIIIMKYALKKYPAEEENIYLKLGFLYIRDGNSSKAFEIWKAGLEKGHFYGLNHSSFDKYCKDNPDFTKLREIEQSMDNASHVEYEVVLPNNHNSKNSYPILFIFHGNGRNLEKAKKSWSSNIMKDKYISIYVQSYAHANSNNFNWITDEKTKNEFKEIYNNVMSTYSIDINKIIFAGMSAGGRIVLDFAFNEFVPLSGIILNCPVIPDSISDSEITHFVEKNKRIGIITGEKDWAFEKQNELISKVKNQGGQNKMTVNKEIGHTFADNFTDLLDEYLSWMLD